MHIRKLTESDVEQFWNLRFKSLLDSPDAFGALYEEEIKKPFDGLISRYKKDFIMPKEDNFVLGAFNEENEILGVVGFFREIRAKMRHKGSVWGMYVVPDMRQRGIGRELLSELIKKVKLMEGIEQINLGVVSSNIKAKELYSSMGFTTYGLEKNAFKVKGEYFDDEFMVLFIN